jgi:hypothetical protein
MFRFPEHFPPMNRAVHDRPLGLREAFIAGWGQIGEKQEQSKN